MKLIITIILLTAIAISSQLYFNGQGGDGGSFPAIAGMPILIAVLLLLIYFFSHKKTDYRKTFGIIFLVWLPVLIYYVYLAMFVQGMAAAFQH